MRRERSSLVKTGRIGFTGSVCLVVSAMGTGFYFFSAHFRTFPHFCARRAILPGEGPSRDNLCDPAWSVGGWLRWPAIWDLLAARLGVISATAKIAAPKLPELFSRGASGRGPRNRSLMSFECIGAIFAWLGCGAKPSIGSIGCIGCIGCFSFGSPERSAFSALCPSPGWGEVRSGRVQENATSLGGDSGAPISNRLRA